MVALQESGLSFRSILPKVKNCTLEIISVGNELLLGNTINTNASWIAARATKDGASVTRITTVGDRLAEIIRVVRESARRKPNYIVTTGGIGPTFDDMTIKAIAKAVRQNLRVNPAALAMVKQHYSHRFPGTVEITKARLKMATLPVHGVAVPNPVGTAPALMIRLKQTVIFCLPGVPREAHAIFKKTIAPQIRLRTSHARFVERWMKVFGVMESTLAPLIDQTMHRWPSVYIKSHPRGFEGQGIPHIDLHFSEFSSNSKKTEIEISSAVSFMTGKLRGLNARISMEN
jgi:molybdenum cofactor synthesis domain-containing protein